MRGCIIRSFPQVKLTSALEVGGTVFIDGISLKPRA
jgi:hypothetical protein